MVKESNTLHGMQISCLRSIDLKIYVEKQEQDCTYVSAYWPCKFLYFICLGINNEKFIKFQAKATK
jgi:hypothetical protein